MGTDEDEETDTGGETTGTQSCEEVVFADPALEQYVRDALGIEGGPITGTQMAELTTIHVSLHEFGEEYVGLRSLAGLECAVNLEELTWEDGLAYDFEGLDPLAGLSKLRTLVLVGGPLFPLDPLAGLSQLEVLSLRALKTPDLGPLAGLSELRVLTIVYSRVTDVSALEGLTALEELVLDAYDADGITDITPLAGLENLRRLHLNSNQIADVEPLGGLVELEELSLEVNPVVEIGALAGLPKLHTLDLLGTLVSDVSPLADLDQIHFINLSAAQVMELSGWLGAAWETPMGCADIGLSYNPLTEQTVAEVLPQICVENPTIAIWIGVGLEPFCNLDASCMPPPRSP